MPADSKLIVQTIGAVARHLGVSERQVGYYFSAGCPRGDEDGGYNLSVILAWVKRHVWDRNGRVKPVREFDDREIEEELRLARSKRTRSAARLSLLVDVPVQTIRLWMADPTFPASPDGSVSEWAFCVWVHRTGRQIGEHPYRVKTED